MVKWFKIFGNQYFGFWSLGLVLFVLQEVPYMIMPFLKLSNNPIMEMPESSAVLNICEKIAGSLCIAFMTFIIRENCTFFSVGNGLHRIGFLCAVLVLLLNYTGWMLYFNGFRSITVMMLFLVALPPLYYIFIGLWRGNWALLMGGIIFEIVHFIHVLGNLTS